MSRTQKLVNMPKHDTDIAGMHKVERVHAADEDYHQAGTGYQSPEERERDEAYQLLAECRVPFGPDGEPIGID